MNCISRSPTFQDFVAAGLNGTPTTAFVYKDGLIERKLPFEADAEVLNIRTWEAFIRALEKEFTPKHRKAIEGRYGLNLERRIGASLEWRDIVTWSVAKLCVYLPHLKEQQGFWARRTRDLADCSPNEIHKLYMQASRNGYLGTVEDPTRIDGGIRHIHEQFVSDYFLRDQQRCNLFRGISDLVSKDPKIPRFHPYYSRLEMAIISLLETDPENPTLELVIPAPGNQDGQPDYYRVHKIISKGGLNAIALVPISNQSNLDPLICFRCTKQTLGQHEALESNLENFNEHVGQSGYEACRLELAELANDPEFNRGKKFNVIPYSQGGSYAAYFMRDHWQKVGQFIGFNCVGSDARIVDAIADEINALGEHEIPPTIYQHRNVSTQDGMRGDWVNYVGEKHLGCGILHPNAITCVVEWLIHDYPAPTFNIWSPIQVDRWFKLHATRPMDTVLEGQQKTRWSKPWDYKYKLHMGPTQVSEVLYTYKRDSTLEDLRRNIGYKIVYNLTINIVKWLNFFFRIFDFKFFNG